MPVGEKVNSDPRIVTIDVTDAEIIAELADGSRISVPLVWSWRLTNAAREQRKNYELIGSGEGVHWPDVDEDISARGMLQGVPAPPPKSRRHARGNNDV